MPLLHQLLFSGILVCCAVVLRGEETAPFPPRVPFTSSRIVSTPEPPSPFITERAFPELKFASPVDLSDAPGTPRLFIVEQGGKVFSFDPQQAPAQAHLTADLKNIFPDLTALYALTFHPQFEQNRYCYLCVIFKPEDPRGSRISRFTMTQSDPPTIDPQSELPLIEWLSGGHNGCCLKFGPDGYLYISTGDASAPSPPDGLVTGQNLTDLLSCILRIDVDHPTAGLNYSIPPDNPFVNIPQARGEIYAIGFRNPWRMSFDPRNGDLWVGDVGWERWELLFNVVRGGNYGWSIMEGSQTVRSADERGPIPISPPVIELPHSEAASITGGLVYRGQRIPELQNCYLYGDWETGKFWSLKYEQGKILEHRELVDTTIRPISFAEDRDRELYILDYGAGGIHRFAPNPRRDQPSNFPHQLSRTGLFTDIPSLTPAPGVIPYQIAAEPWQDGLVATRWAALPGLESSDLHNDPNATFKNPLAYPEQSIFVKTISLPGPSPDQPGRRIETQVLHIHEGFSRGYSYRWTDDQTDAELVDAAGEEIPLRWTDPVEGKEHSIRHRLHSRAECARCHNQWTSFVIGFTPAQLDRQVSLAGKSASQLDLLRHWKLFTPQAIDQTTARLVDPYDSSAGTLDQRARSYLDVNCAGCHRMSGGGSTNIELIVQHPLDKTKLISQPPLQGSLGLYHGEIVAPGDPYRSVLFYRLAKTGTGHMPHIGTRDVDPNGLTLIHDWIKQLPPAKSPETGADIRRVEDATATRLTDPALTAEQALPLIDRLLESSRGALRLSYELSAGKLPTSLTPNIVQRGTAHPEPVIRDLFERFLPEDQRVARLGSGFPPEQLLAIPGDAARGRELFTTGRHIVCRNCHKIGDIGTEVGPALSLIGRKHTREKLLQELIEPSRTIEQKYLTYVAELKSGMVHSGILISRTPDRVLLKNIRGELLDHPASEIESLTPQPTSLMPEDLLRDLPPQEAADLIEYLSSLK